MFHFEINVLHTSQAPFETYFNAIFNNEIGKILFWVEIICWKLENGGFSNH